MPASDRIKPTESVTPSVISDHSVIEEKVENKPVNQTFKKSVQVNNEEDRKGFQSIQPSSDDEHAKVNKDYEQIRHEEIIQKTEHENKEKIILISEPIKRPNLTDFVQRKPKTTIKEQEDTSSTVIIIENLKINMTLIQFHNTSMRVILIVKLLRSCQRLKRLIPSQR